MGSVGQYDGLCHPSVAGRGSSASLAIELPADPSQQPSPLLYVSVLLFPCSGAWIVRNPQGEVGFVSCRDLVLSHYLMGEEEVLAMMRKTTAEVSGEVNTAKQRFASHPPITNNRRSRLGPCCKISRLRLISVAKCVMSRHLELSSTVLLIV